MSARDELKRDLMRALNWASIDSLANTPDHVLAEKIIDAPSLRGYRDRNQDAELAKYKRGAKTLGEIIEKQCREVLDVTGLHHLINEDGDGHWDVVWMRLHEMREELKDLKESTIARERKRGDAWRDRAQEMDSRAQSLEVELLAAKPQQITTAVELAAPPDRRRVAQVIQAINRLLRRVGLVIVPTPPSARMLHEHANVSECHHPSRGGRTVEWMREVAEATK